MSRTCTSARVTLVTPMTDIQLLSHYSKMSSGIKLAIGGFAGINSFAASIFLRIPLYRYSMHLPLLHLAFVLLAWTLFVHAAPALEPRATTGISQELFDELKFYFQYASSSSSDACASPNGHVFVKKINNVITDTQGFIARDDDRKEIIVALRGSQSLIDGVVDIAFIPVPIISRGIKAPLFSFVHAGFLTAYNSVADGIINTVKSELALHPGYSLVTSGHSLGGALASIAGLSLQQNFHNNTVRMYTYGQPRTFNSVAAFFINKKFGDKAHRSVHVNDIIPHIVPQGILDFRHHGVEYWQFTEPAVPANIKSCNADGEDPKCSKQISSIGGDSAHGVYYGVQSGTKFC
ncbi:hypothetical protein HGRIS_010780 [Hohenbuehelia grisea]|uniref:Fungal lipase-type domain-containing protein n=1 Tax=Hohenbuehelia grisea TaxID=104357 RepID=A0ABR3IXZ2_9AGAR